MPDFPFELEKHDRTNQAGGSDQTPAFGQRIRAMRKAAGLTLEDLSASSGISRAALSKIERGEMSPTYESLLKLARGLETDLAALVSGRRPSGGGFSITRAGEGAAHCTDRFVHQLLAPDLPDRALFAFVTEVHATQLDEYDTWDSHDSEDLIFILDGSVEVHLSNRAPARLRRGDSMQMDGRIPHALVAVPSSKKKNQNKPVARLLWVSTPFR